MSYENFKPEVWSKKVQLELEKLMVFRDICNTQFQGDVGRGKTVKIIGVDRPKVNTYVPGTDILDAETPQDSSVYLAVDQFKYTHFMVDDIDGMQGDTPIMEHLMHGSATALAEAADAYIAEKVKEAGIVIPSQAISTAAQAKEALDEAFEKLWSNSVKIGMDTYIVVTPWFYNLFKDRLTELHTDNTDLINKGILGMYNGAKVVMSNNVYNDGTDDYLSVITKDAIAFASGIEKTEAYRPDRQFSDAVKVLHTYGAKVVRPKEMALLKVHQGS